MVGLEEISFLGIKWKLVGFYTSHFTALKKTDQVSSSPHSQMKSTLPDKPRNHGCGAFFAESSREFSINFFSGSFTGRI